MKYYSLRLIILAIGSANLAGTYFDNRQIVIMRHGQSDHNVEKFCSSNTEHPGYRISNLTEAGKEQVLKTANRLKAAGFNDLNVAAVYVSPLPRTQQTAKILMDELDISQSKLKIDIRIIETQCGDLEGRAFVLPWDNAVAAHYDHETKADVTMRMNLFYADLLQDHKENAILVVTHGLPAEVLCEIVSGGCMSIQTGDAYLFALKESNILGSMTFAELGLANLNDLEDNQS